MSTRSDLIVPVRDRRQHRRILTLKNCWRALLVISVFALGMTIESDLRHPESDGYGRLFATQVAARTAVAPKKVEPVREAPVEDQTAADPLLVSAAAREQYLGSGPTATSAPSQSATVSGPNGITIVVGRSERRPTLSGGIFRQ